MNRTLPWLHIYRDRDGEGDGGTTTAAATETTSATETTAATTTEKAAETATTTATTEKPAFDYSAWAEGLTDAQKKDYAKRFKGGEDLLDAALNMRKDLSSRVKLPGKDATPEEIAAFRNAIGADPDPVNYKASVPEGYELNEVSTALLGQMQQAAAETGVPKASFEQFTKTYFEMEQAVQAKIAEEVATFQRDSTAALKKEFGADFDTKVRIAETFINQRLNVPEFTELLNDQVQWKGVAIELRSHPAVVKMLAQIGQRTAEDGVIGHTTPEESSSLRAQIAELEAKYPLATRTKAQDTEIRAKYEKLYG